MVGQPITYKSDNNDLLEKLNLQILIDYQNFYMKYINFMQDIVQTYLKKENKNIQKKI